jgi:threonine dehydratase
MELVPFDDVRLAARRIEGKAHRTPLLTSRTLDRLARARLYLKMECFQRTGSFKFRGATNAVAQLPEAVRRQGVLTFSSGNHAQALAAACQAEGVPAVIVMPNDAPRVKLEATRGYGAEVVLFDPDETRREALGAQIAEERGLTVVPPFDHPHIVAGQGTAALEAWEDAGPFDWVVVPCGGGGLMGGTSVVSKALGPGCRVVGVEPEAGDDFRRSLEAGQIVRVHNPQTIADGARTPSPGNLTFAMAQEYVDEVTTVDDGSLVGACRLLWERCKCVVEPTGALALAAVLEGRVRPGGRVLVLVSGGNVDLASAAGWLQ